VDWYGFWHNTMGFDQATAIKAANAAYAHNMVNMYQIIRASPQYNVIFPGIHTLVDRGALGNTTWGAEYTDPTATPEAAYMGWKNSIQSLAANMGFGQQTTANLAHYAYSGWSSGDVSNYFTGWQQVKAQLPDIQYAFGNFGTGALSTAQLDQLAAGLGNVPSKSGMNLQSLFQQYQNRAQSAFQGALANVGQTLGVAGRGTTDVGA